MGTLVRCDYRAAILSQLIAATNTSLSMLVPEVVGLGFRPVK